MCHIIITEQQELLRMGLRYSLSSPNTQINTQPCNFTQLINHLQNHHCDVLFVDYRVLASPNNDSLMSLKRMNTTMKIVVAATTDSYFNFYLLLKEGIIDGLCLKTDASSAFHHALKAVLINQSYISETIIAALSQQNSKLTPKELQVIELLVLGLNNKEVAHTLNNSERTINVHRSNIMHKLNLSNVVELINYAYQNGMSKLNFCH